MKNRTELTIGIKPNLLIKGLGFLFFVLVSFVFVGTTVSQAATHYVYCGATGAANGAEWTDAYTDLPAALNPGDTYVIAGSSSCNYGPHTFRDNASASNPITIRYAESSLDSVVAGSPIAGWNPSFGTTQALFTTGTGATVNITTDSNGSITHGVIVNGGTQYTVNSTFYVLEGSAANGGSFTVTSVSPGGVITGITPLPLSGGKNYTTASGLSTIVGYVWAMEGPYYIFNGVTGSGYTGYGIKVWGKQDVNGGVITAPYGSGTVTNLTFENLEVEAPSFNQTYTAEYPMYFNSNVSNLLVNNCFIHNGITWLGVEEDSTNVTIENSHFQNAGTQSGSHATGIFVENQVTFPSNLIIANNVIENMVGTSNTSYIELAGGTGWGGIAIYGNLIWNSYGPGEETAQSAIGTAGSSPNQANNVKIYNNTFYGLNCPYPHNAGAIYFQAPSTNIDVENNIWQNISSTPAFTGVTTNLNNIINTGAANFVNPSGGNFQLTQHTAPGSSLPSPYNVDAAGNMRGSGGNWDIGAYQEGRVYYIAANGSDSNTGTSKSSPWLDAPGMPNCSSNCAATTPKAADSYIFKGGDTWHMNAAAGAPVGLPWNWTWSGSTFGPIYIGVDKTWSSGSLWTRPIMNWDNLPSTATVGSCAYDETSSPPGVYIQDDDYVTFDNFEFTGMCWQTYPPPYGNATYLNRYGTGITVSNNYFHGWSHGPSTCYLTGSGLTIAITVGSTAAPAPITGGMIVNAGSGYTLNQTVYLNQATSGGNGIFQITSVGSGGTATAIKLITAGTGYTTATLPAVNNAGCDGGTIVNGYTGAGADNGVLSGNSFDGSDTDHQSMSAVFSAAYDFHDNLVRYVSNGVVVDNMHTIHNNIFEDIVNSYDTTQHSNTIETNAEMPMSNYIYDNIFTQNNTAVHIWTIPAVGQTDYYYNNVIFDIKTGVSAGQPVASECWNIAGAGAAVYFINNTIDASVSPWGSCFIAPLASNTEGGPYKGYMYFYNNHLIGYSGLTTGNVPLTTTDADNSGADAIIVEGQDSYRTEAAANAQGYLPDNNYAPAPNSSATIAAGPNLPSLYPAIMSAPSMPMDINRTSRPATGNWDIGAYQFFSSSAVAPTVSLTTDYPSYSAPATIVLTATALAASGANISAVAFYNGTTFLGTSISPDTPGGSTYSYTWSGVILGTCNLSAVAYDSNFHSTTSTTVTIAVGTSSGFQSGDVNGDGIIDIADAEMAARAAIGLITLNTSQLQAAIVSSSSETKPTIYDAELIAQYARYLITKFPAT